MLMETLSAVAAMQDLRAEHDGPIQGYVLESKVHKGLGSVVIDIVPLSEFTCLFLALSLLYLFYGVA